MVKLLIVLIVALLFEAVGVVYLSKGLKEVGKVREISFSEFIRVAKAGATNHKLLLGIFLDAIFFGCMVYLMSQADVSFIWPFTALGLVIMTLAARFILHEEVTWLRWVGVVLIMIGAGVITYTEKVAEQKRQSHITASSGDVSTRPQ
jgi:uncharacterized membrane protein